MHISMEKYISNIVFCILKIEFVIPIEAAPKSRYTATIKSKAITIDKNLLLSLFQDLVLIISTKIKAVIEINILAKVANMLTLKSVKVIFGMLSI